ncbi:MAG: asparagine synthase (glutamine-hydrolyzing) [Victivallaceae bacterium]|nr:asparagine synthase (glutamine-hydrolyzing) [Victivallaceae bacterium]
MCGIAGILNYPAASLSREEAVFTTAGMAQRLLHRGPDGAGSFVDASVAFHHRRLAIIDLATGGQPLYNEDRSLVLIYNGEIYNYQELSEQLRSKGHTFRTQSDGECILHLYEEEQGNPERVLRHLRGMFALALYDTVRKRVILGRDRLGQKPLCYFQKGEALWFASTPAALHEAQDAPKQLDLEALGVYFSLGCVPPGATACRGMLKLPPGSLLQFELCPDAEAQRCRVRRYWHLDYSVKCELTFDEAREKFRELFAESVKLRMRSDVPLGVFLSGGLDSALVAWEAGRQLKGEPLRSYTIGFTSRRYDERSLAAITAGELRRDGIDLQPHEKVVNPCDFSLLEKLLAECGEPYADASMLPTYLLSEFTSSEVKLALSGDGADEFFGGYERYLVMRYAQLFDRIPRLLRETIRRTACSVLPDGGERSRSGRMRRLLTAFGAAPQRRYATLLDRCPAEVRKGLFATELTGALSHDAGEFFGRRILNLLAVDPAEQAMELDAMNYLVMDTLPKTDLMSMAASLEVRSPFLDHRLVEFAVSLPAEYKLNKFSRKHLLKAAYSQCLPGTILDRPKKGFGVPVSIWLRGAWHDRAYAMLFEESPLVRENFVSAAGLKKIWQMHCSGRGDYSYLLWHLLVFAIWLKNFRAAPSRMR